MFYQNKYTKLYYKIVESAKAKEYDCYTENHHIIPRCLNGSDDSSNMVTVSYREHYLLHYLLTKMSDDESLKNCFWMMNNKNRDKYVNSKLYEYSRRCYVDRISGDNHWAKTDEFRRLVSESWTEERKENFKEAVSGDKHWTTGKDMRSHAELMRESKTEDSHKKQSESLKKFYKDNPEAKKKLGDANRGVTKTKVTCPHCGKTGGKPVMTRYHFDKCKEFK